MEAAGPERIFLYGTLRRGGTRDVLRHYEGAVFVGPARVRGVLHDLGDYPGLRLADDDGWVLGESFDVSARALALLDEWEGIGETDEYRRVRLSVVRDDAVEICWGYEAAAWKCAGRPVIPSGDWLAHAAAR